MFASQVRTFGHKAGRTGPARRSGLRLEVLGERAAPASQVGASSGGDCITFGSQAGTSGGGDCVTFGSSVGYASGGDCVTLGGTPEGLDLCSGCTGAGGIENMQPGEVDLFGPKDIATPVLFGSGNASGGGIELIVGAGDVSLLAAKPPTTGTGTPG